MRAAVLRQKIKVWMLPVAMLIGIIFHDSIGKLEFLAPWLIFAMLLVTFCRVEPRRLRFSRLSWKLIAVQFVGSLAVFFALLPLNRDIAAGAFIVVFCPTATAAPVVTHMLGGDIDKVVAYSILSNMVVAFTAPLIFTLMGTAEVHFLDAVRSTALKVMPLIIAPLVVALIMMKITPKTHETLAHHASISFYIWALSLIIVVGNSTSRVLAEPQSLIPVMIALAGVSLILCLGQFGIGRLIGRREGDPVSGAQSLGQKNTVLAIWMALTWLNPVVSVAPAAYVAWQNTVNSLQIFIKQKSSKNNNAHGQYV